MSISVHNPDRYMSDLRTIIAQGRKRIGFLIGAGAAAGLKSADGTKQLIPAVAGLTEQVLQVLEAEYGPALESIKASLEAPNIESILSKIRALSSVIGESEIDGLTGKGYAELGDKICAEIGKIVAVSLPVKDNPYSSIVKWIVGSDRQHPVEIFTTNYDLLFEEAFENSCAPYFDGFSGARKPFFDAVTTATNDLPARWTRLWKLHGSLGWESDSEQGIIRVGGTSAKHLIFPEHLKYNQTQKAPYSALFDRLSAFLLSEDTLLIAIGFSFADAHVAANVEQSLAANPSASVFAFQYQNLKSENSAKSIALRRPNFSVYSRDKAIINGIEGQWKLGQPLSKDWGAIRSTYWAPLAGTEGEFSLGDFTKFADFFASSKSQQALNFKAEEEE